MNKTSNLRRLMNEDKQIRENAEQDASMFQIMECTDGNLYLRKAIIYGPKDSLYDGYKFELSIVLPDNYPTAPLTMKFITRIEHVNVNSKGDICMDILNDKWTPSLNIRGILISLISLLSQPNPEDPLNSDLAELFRKDMELYEKTIIKCCEKYASKI